MQNQHHTTSKKLINKKTDLFTIATKHHTNSNKLYHANFKYQQKTDISATARKTAYSPFISRCILTATEMVELDNIVRSREP